MTKGQEGPELLFGPSVNGNGNNNHQDRPEWTKVHSQGVFTREHRQEFRQTLADELKMVADGKSENALLLTGLCNNWSADHLRNVARQRGMNWRFASALSDQTLRIEGFAILLAHAQAMGADVFLAMLHKVGLTFNRIRELELLYTDYDLIDDHFAEIIAMTKDALVNLTRYNQNAFIDAIKRTLFS